MIILQAPEAAENDTKVVDFDICVAELYIKNEMEIHADWDRWNLNLTNFYVLSKI